MTNNINIVWTSDQRQVIGDMQKRLALLQRENSELKDLTKSWRGQGDAIGIAYRNAQGEISRLGKIAVSSFKDSAGPMNAHLSRMKELRVLYRMGKIDAEQYRQAVQGLNRDLVAGMNFPKGNDPASLADGFGLLAGRIFGVAAAYKALTAANQFWMQSNKEAQVASEEAAAKQEEQILRFRVQAGIGKLKGAAAKSSIYKSALATSTTSEEAFSAATAMVSTGFDPNVAQGSGLTPFLKLLKGQALDPRKAVSPTETAEAFSKFLSATGEAKTGANVEKLAIAVQGLKATPMKVTDMGQLAKHASALKTLGNLSPEEMLSNFAFLTNTEIPEEAGTHMREIVRQLATSGGSPKATKQLAMMGLSPQDVDFVGENFSTVLGRVKGGLNQLPAEERANAMDVLVEGRNISSFTKLMNSQGEVARYRELMKDKKGFDADFATISGGQNAKVARIGVAKEMIRAARDSYSKEDRENFQLYLEEKHNSPVVRAGAMAIYDMMDAGYGHDAHMTMAGGANILAGGNGDAMTTQVGRMIEREKELAEAKRVIEEYRREKAAARQPNGAVQRPMQINVAPPRVNINMPGGGEKAPSVPAHLLSNTD